MRGYAAAEARQAFRDPIDLPADATIDDRQVHVCSRCRAHLPIMFASGLMDRAVKVPCWNGLILRMTG